MIRARRSVVLVVLVVAACTASGAPVTSPGGRYPGGGGSTPTVPPAATPPTQTQTGWGLIWDGLPPSFPRYPGAEPTQTGSGPASAVLNVPADARTAATWYATALKAAGFSTVGANGPLENGSFVVDSTAAAAGCRAQATLVPLGATTTATIYLAAACPFN